MKHSIKKLDITLPIINDGGKVDNLQGYSFHDECGRCFIIVYSERKRDLIDKYLNTMPL